MSRATCKKYVRRDPELFDAVLLGLPPNPPSVTWDRLALPATQRQDRVRERESNSSKTSDLGSWREREGTE
jgi:hypothetical protein